MGTVAVRDRLLQHLGARGISATLKYYTGTDCPCRTFNDSANYSYSPEWHRLYPTAEDCGGTLKIATNKVERVLKIFVGNPTTIATMDNFRSLLPAGTFEKNDVLAIAALDEATSAMLTMTSYENNKTASMLIEKIEYSIMTVIDLVINQYKWYMLIMRLKNAR
jgi:hypothetical protein